MLIKLTIERGSVVGVEDRDVVQPECEECGRGTLALRTHQQPSRASPLKLGKRPFCVTMIWNTAERPDALPEPIRRTHFALRVSKMLEQLTMPASEALQAMHWPH